MPKIINFENPEKEKIIKTIRDLLDKAVSGEIYSIGFVYSDKAQLIQYGQVGIQNRFIEAGQLHYLINKILHDGL